MIISRYIYKMFLSSLPVVLTLGCCLPYCSCSSDLDKSERRLTVSIEPLKFIAEAIAGDCYEVSTITPEGISPEAYMPTPQQITSISTGTAYIYLGSLGFEQQNLNRIVDNCPHLYTINVSENIALLPQDDCCSSSDSSDPHIWTSPKNMKTIAHNIHKALCSLDSANISLYNERLAVFNAHMDSINMAIHQKLDSVSERTFLINHPSLGYFATQYDLKQISVEKDGKEASAERVARLIDQCRQDNVRHLFLQKQNNKRTVCLIAQEIKADTLTINPLAYRWDEEMLHIAEFLAK